MASYEVRIVDDFGDIAPVEWNAVAGDTLQRGYRWQRYKQASQDRSWPGAWTKAVTVRKEGRLVGVATAYRYAIPLGFSSSTLRSISRVLLWPANPVNFLLPPQVDPGIDEAEVYSLLFRGIRSLVRKKLSLGARMVFLEEPRDAGLISRLKTSGYSIREGLWQTQIDISWPTFTAFTEQSRGDLKYEVRRQRKKAVEGGVAVVTELPKEARKIYALFRNVAEKNRSRLLYHEGFLEDAERILGKESFTLLQAERHGRTIACLLLYHDDATAQIAAFGLDYAHPAPCNLYRLLFYSAIEMCIERKLRTIIGGISQYDLKKDLGFYTKPTCTASYSWVPLGDWFFGYTPKSLQDKTRVEA